MEKKFNKATSQRPGGMRVLDDVFVITDIKNKSKQLRHEAAWKESDRNSITVFKTGNMTIVLTAFQKGAEMSDLKTDSILSLQVLEGEISFSVKERSIFLNKAQIITLHENIPYSINAVKESVFLMSFIETI